MCTHGDTWDVQVHWEEIFESAASALPKYRRNEHMPEACMYLRMHVCQTCKATTIFCFQATSKTLDFYIFLIYVCAYKYANNCMWVHVHSCMYTHMCVCASPLIIRPLLLLVFLLVLLHLPPFAQLNTYVCTKPSNRFSLI